MKKVFASLLAGAVCLSLAALPVSAGSATEAGDIELGTNFTFEYKNDPTYTVTIPDALTIEKEGSVMSIEASDVENLGDQKISVTIAGTSGYNDQMVLEADTSPRTSIRYQIISESGELIETNASTGAVGVGKEVVSFTENGTKQYQIKPVIAGRYEYDVEYTGCIMFGIEVTDAE